MIDPIARADIQSIQPTSPDPAELRRRQEIAKEFESLLMTRLLSQMGNTIVDWDEQDDLAGQQIQGLFWLQLADYVGRNGGIGLWTQILQQINQAEAVDTLRPMLDDML